MKETVLLRVLKYGETDTRTFRYRLHVTEAFSRVERSRLPARDAPEWEVVHYLWRASR